MSTSFVEATLSQIFKERDGQNFVGGMAYYGRKLCKGAAWVGVALSALYIIYAFLCLPAQGYNTITGFNQVASTITGTTVATDSVFNYVVFALMIVFVAYLSIGGIRRVTKFTDGAVPVMAVVYIGTVLVLIAINFQLIPWFFYAVFTEAFAPNAIFGGAFGVALQQGIKRGLMSNEAGQGTISMAAATSNAKHPCEQGNVQSLGVFFDTIVICTPTAFVVVMAHLWLGDGGEAFMALDKLPKFVSSADFLVGNAVVPSMIVTVIVSVCFALFALTTLVGFLSFTDICAKRISNNKVFIWAIKICCLAIICFGVLANFAGLDLSALWNLSDLANIMMVYINIPLLYVGLPLVLRTYKHYNKNAKYMQCIDEKQKYNYKLKKLIARADTSGHNEKIDNKIAALNSKLAHAERYIKDHKTDGWQFTSKVVGVDVPV